MTKIAVPQKDVLQAALISETILFVIALTWAYFRNIDLHLLPSHAQFVTGLYASGPIIAFNFALFVILIRRKKYVVYQKFFEEVVAPLCANLNIVSALLVSLAAGIGEEVLFRGILNPELASLLGETVGIALGAFVFAWIHFIGNVRAYWQVFLFYYLFSLYFSYLVLDTANLPVAITCHATYDFAAILYVRYLSRRISG